MDKVEADIDNLRASVFELKSSLYRADRAHMSGQRDKGLSVRVNLAATCLLALFFLLV